MNNITLMGRLCADPELKQTPNGASVTSFSLAVKRPHTSDTTDFINIVAWRQTAEFVCKYFKKGSMIALTGVLTARKWQDRDGNNRTAFEVVADNVEFCEKKSTEPQDPAYVPQAYTASKGYETIAYDGDLPF